MITKTLIEQHIQKGLSYQEYSSLIEKLLSQNKTTGSNQSNKMIEYTQLNQQRSKRIEKTIHLDEELSAALQEIRQPWYWVVLTEAWCGDAAQNIPIIAKMAEANPHIKIKLLLRDENPEVMQAYLTNGSKSIPKLICLKSDNLQELGTWGPRPKPAQEMVRLYKENPTVIYSDFVKELQLWYAKDKGKTIQSEFKELIKEWISDE